MATQIPGILPVVGNWYQDQIQNLYFEVVDVDQRTGDVQIQYYDGEVEGYDRESWQMLQLTIAAPPEDPASAYDTLEEGDWYSGDTPRITDWNNPLDSIEPQGFDDIDDYF